MFKITSDFVEPVIIPYMTLGTDPLGTVPVGSTSATPEPDEFEELSEEEKDEIYREVHQDVQELKSNFEQLREENDKYRTRTWIWRIGSFILGNFTGAFLTIVL